MFVELIDTLRCTADHEESWLVAAAHRSVGRSIMDGELGCHVCGARYPIRNGVADFRRGELEPGRLEPDERVQAASDPESMAMRLGAMLGLTTPGGAIVIEGQWAIAAASLASLIPAYYLIVDPPDDFEIAEPLGGLRVADRFPIRTAGARGVALHGGRADLARDAARILAVGGRLYMPSTTQVPDGLSVVASDADWQILEKPAPTVSISRRRDPDRGSR